MDYKGFKIKKQGWTFSYGNQSSKYVHYIVYKEVNGEKCFIDYKGNTAFDTEEEAKRVIDLIVK